MWSDNETDQDLLGFSIHADLLYSILIDPEMLPLTVGLFGDWGGGKSSILKILKNKIEANDDVAVIYFNGWIFEGYEDAKYAILTSVLKELEKSKKIKEKIADEIVRLYNKINWMKLFKLGSSIGASYVMANPLPLLMHNFMEAEEGKALKDVAKDSKVKLEDVLKNTQKNVDNVKSFRSDFQKLVKKTKLQSVVVLIDDLDRCSPDRIIENLEAIKLFLNVKQTAFVVATDRRIIENAIRIRYSDLFDGSEAAGRGSSLVIDYLEKLVQVPYTLPKLAPHEVRSYLCMLFLKKYLDSSKFDLIYSRYKEFLSSKRYTAFVLKDEFDSIVDGEHKQKISESMRLVEACSDSITDGLKGNPRQIKRFLNSFWLRKELAKASNILDLKDHILIKLMVLEYISPDRLDELYRWHRNSNDGTAEQLKIIESTEKVEDLKSELDGWKTQSIWKWIKSEPRIGTVDLRDYFWIARNAISETLSGVRLMTNSMKACVDELISTFDKERAVGVELFSSLMVEEQNSVLGLVSKHAMQDCRDDSPLRSMLALASKSHKNAAESLVQCVKRIGSEHLPPSFGVTLRSFNPLPGCAASDIIIRLREELGEQNTYIGRALKSKVKGKS